MGDNYLQVHSSAIWAESILNLRVLIFAIVHGNGKRWTNSSVHNNMNRQCLRVQNLANLQKYQALISTRKKRSPQGRV